MDDMIEDFRSINFATLLYDAATALFWYDYCLTFAQDIRHICHGPCVSRSRRCFSLPSAIPLSSVFYLSSLHWLITDSAFSALRAYALCGRNTWMLALVMLLGLVNPTISLLCVSLDTGLRKSQGFVLSSSPGMIVARTASVVADALVLASKVTTVLMRDGTFYLMVLLIITLVALGLSRASELIEAISSSISGVRQSLHPGNR
ncbi:hypothetical protein OH76DRAFT_1487110 [Lentinus brumalis]|uniref:Uncharacterized protein n=1 Tax=Lentinus brumalis TaxID=2498619 RepID=A0A371CVR8_9APHY|nr:hypothetical protein OH76DRAFT_1487110 [Polyporus brumalis]